MRKASAFLSLLGIVIVVAVESRSAANQTQAETKTPQSETQSVLQVETALFRAKMTTDPVVIGNFVADDWVNIAPTGWDRGWGKAPLMEHLRQHSGERPPYSGRQQDLEVFVFGDTAVATYVEVDTAEPDKNLPRKTQQLDGTDVFVKSDGVWKLRLSRASPHLQQ
jgi:ketosteroid isomerase-like protein